MKSRPSDVQVRGAFRGAPEGEQLATPVTVRKLTIAAVG